MIIVPFIPAHLKELELHEYMSYMQASIKEAHYGELLAQFPAYSGLVEGQVIACSGIIQAGVNRWEAWTLMSPETKDYMIPITKGIKNFLDEVKPPRIQTHVRADFEAGHRWAKMLGFKNETPDGMKNWGDDGYDYCLYSRINEYEKHNI